MPRGTRSKENEWQRYHEMKLMFIGIMLIIVGLLFRYGYSWDTVFIVVGVIVLLKGLAKKFMKM